MYIQFTSCVDEDLFKEFLSRNFALAEITWIPFYNINLLGRGVYKMWLDRLKKQTPFWSNYEEN